MNEHEQQAGAGSFWDWLRDLGITRSRSERWFAGVAGGIAERTKLDPLIWRGIFLVLVLFGGPGLLLYFVGWLLLPDRNGTIHLEDLVRGVATRAVTTVAVVAGIVLVLGMVLGIGPGLFNVWDLWSPFNADAGWVSVVFTVTWWTVITGLGIWFVVWLYGRSRESSDGTSRSADSEGANAVPHDGSRDTGEEDAQGQHSYGDRTREFTTRVTQESSEAGQRLSDAAQKFGTQVSAAVSDAEERCAASAPGTGQTILTLAFACLAGGLVAGLGLTDGWGLNLWQLSTADSLFLGGVTAAGTLGISAIIAGIRGRRTGWIGGLSFVGVILLVVGTIMPAESAIRPFGTQHATPATLAEFGHTGILTIAGQVDFDLRDLDRRGAKLGETYTLSAAAGSFDISLPEDVPVRVESRILAGQTNFDGSERERELRGPFLVQSTLHNPDTVEDHPVTTVEIWLIAGRTTVIEGA